MEIMGLETIYEAILTGEINTTKAETQAGLIAGTSAADILHKACIPAMTEIGPTYLKLAKDLSLKCLFLLVPCKVHWRS